MQKVRTGRGQGVYNDQEAVSQIVTERAVLYTYPWTPPAMSPGV